VTNQQSRETILTRKKNIIPNDQKAKAKNAQQIVLKVLTLIIKKTPVKKLPTKSRQGQVFSI